jgi:hemoglobin-like flavoprotein
MFTSLRSQCPVLKKPGTHIKVIFYSQLIFQHAEAIMHIHFVSSSETPFEQENMLTEESPSFTSLVFLT